jgi:hypothetical protein
MLLGGHPSSMLMLSMSVLAELVVEYSEILFFGISYSNPKIEPYPRFTARRCSSCEIG